MHRMIAALLVLAFLRPDALIGQTVATAATLAPGARVRITSPGAKARIATVVSTAPDTLFVRWPQFSGTEAVPVAGISRLEVSTGRSRRVVKGMTLGTVSGGAAGALMGAVTYEPCNSEEFLGCFLAPRSRAESAGWGAVAGGVLGFAVGSLAGLPRREDWRQVSLAERRVALAVAPRANGTRLGVSIQF